MRNNKYSDIKVVFSFNVYLADYEYDEDEGPDFEGGAMVTITAKELTEIEARFRNIDGHACSYYALPPKTRKKVEKAAIAEFTLSGKMEPDLDESFYDFNFEEALPPKLIHEIEKFVDMKGMTVKYSISADGNIYTGDVCIGMSVDDFYRFAAVQDEYHEGCSDFDWLKERDKEVYDRVFELVNEWAEKVCMSKGLNDIQPVIMTDCPSELRKYLNGEPIYKRA